MILNPVVSEGGGLVETVTGNVTGSIRIRYTNEDQEVSVDSFTDSGVVNCAKNTMVLAAATERGTPISVSGSYVNVYSAITGMQWFFATGAFSVAVV